jgi:dipeptidyl aminopeptidase/acylaminoacyl peptidase
VGALRDLGRPVEYLELAGEGHEYRTTAARLQLVDALLRFVAPTLGVP